ncbi:hypothetical protein [Pedobacter sp. UYEF25]
MVIKKKISFVNEILTYSIKIGKEEDEAIVHIRITETELLITCNVDTDEDYLSRYAYLLLDDLLFYRDGFDFDYYYWPNFFDSNTGKSKYLDVIHDRSGLTINRKKKYAYFYKPGIRLPEIPAGISQREPLPEVDESISVRIGDQNVTGFCLINTSLKSYHSNHLPFLMPYVASLNRTTKGIKSFLSWNDNLFSVDSSNAQIRLGQICMEMLENCSLDMVYFSGSIRWLTDENKQYAEKIRHIFNLFNSALPELMAQNFTHYYYSYGLKNLGARPRKNDMELCCFGNELPSLLFTLTELKDFYQLELKFRIGKKEFAFAHDLQVFYFAVSVKEPKKFYLLASVEDAFMVHYFSEKNFKMLILKKHHQSHVRYWMDEISLAYEVKINNKNK